MNSPDNNSSKTAKTGRKGDPRMHRAVAARMQNPELSLFEALRAGGFDYAADEDASVTDAEKVTLGQRKNQLSRRLRLARKQQEESGDDESHKTPSRATSKQQQQQQHQHQHQNHKPQVSQSSAAMSSEAQRQLHNLMQHSHQTKMNSAGVKRNAAAAELGPDAEIHPSDDAANQSMVDENKARRMAKFHPQYQPLFIPRAGTFRNQIGSSGNGASAQSHLQQQFAGTPQMGPLASPLSSFGGGGGGSGGGGGQQGGNPGLSGGFASSNSQSTSSLFSPSAALLSQQAASQRRQQASQSHPSGVAIASLSATAQSVGLSLEQLAVALSSSSNLVKVLSNNSGSEQQQELALRLFRNESRALYQRCMLLAGYRPEDAEESATTHLQFAFSAWQMEGKRLQELMGEENKNSINTLAGLQHQNGVGGGSGAAAATQLKMPQNNGQQQQLYQQQQQSRREEEHQRLGHSHGHQHDNANEHDHGHDHQHGGDGHHLHQLEGKCGHKAIIHQPKDGSAHIDFVVGDKVECYHGLKPVGNAKSVSIWPSKYKCEDLSCPTPCAEQLVDDITPVDFREAESRSAPKILDLSDIDLEGTEWNSDLNGSMGGTLLGLFKLGDSDKETTSQNGDQGSSSDLRVLSI